MRPILTASLFLFTFFTTASRADTLKFKEGGELQCSVIQESSVRVTAIYGQGLLTFERSKVSKIEKTNSQTADCSPSTAQLPTWESVMRCAAQQPWSDNLRQIAATVVTAGSLAHVPYKSQKCGEAREINVYGDPANPCGFELGLYDNLAADKAERERAIKWASAFLSEKARALVAGIPLEGGKIESDGLVYEITPPTAADAYGGWWISIYSDSGIKAARATKEELAKITRRIPKQKVGAVKEKTSAPAAKAKADDEEDDDPLISSGRKYDELSKTTVTASSEKKEIENHGPVYVQGYYRKDGTYVRPHTRKR